MTQAAGSSSVRGSGLIQTIWQDVRYAARLLRKQPGFALMAVVTLALGIGASTAIFSVIDAALLRPLPYPEPEQLVQLDPEVIRPDGRTSNPTASMADLRAWQEADDVLAAVAGWGRVFSGSIADGPEPERIEVLQITEQYLSMHGVTPLHGRGITRADTEYGAPRVVLLGYGYWHRRYGGRADVVGETMRLDDGPATIVGVLPSWFNRTTPVTRALQIPPDEVPRRGTGRVSVYARLRPGVTVEQAAEQLSARMPAESGRDGSSTSIRVHVSSLLQSAVASRRTTVNIIAGAVALILLIACVNVAGLLLARGATRQSELSVRASLGAGRGRIVRQLLTESLVLASAGGALGVFLAWLSLDAIVANVPMSLPSNSPATLNPTVLGFTVLLLVPTALLFGLAPAVRLSRVQIGSALGHGGRLAGSSLSKRGGRVLIGIEVALALVLVAGAGLMLRSFARISAVDLGFDPDRLVTMEVTPVDVNGAGERAYYVQLLRALASMPGIAAAGGINYFHLGGTTSFSSVAANGEDTSVNPFDVLPGYFEALDLEVRGGRLPTYADYESGARFVVLSETAARAIFPDGSAVGRSLTRSGENEPYTVSAVVADVRHGGPLAGVERTANQVYFPITPAADDTGRARSGGFVPPPRTSTVIVLRPASHIPDLAQRLRQTARSLGPRVAVEGIRLGSDWFGDRVVTPRRRTVLLSLLGALGLVLAIVGVFGMTAYAVARRTREIGVRMVFGARPGQVVARVLGDMAVPVVIGAVAGLGAAALATRTIRSFLFETDPLDPATFAVVGVVLVTTGLVAAWIPARRAARVDPITALRAE